MPNSVVLVIGRRGGVCDIQAKVCAGCVCYGGGMDSTVYAYIIYLSEYPQNTTCIEVPI